MEINLEDLKNKIKQMSDDDLIKMIKVEYNSYREDAIEFARREFEKRGLSEISQEKIDDIKKTTKPEISIKWLKFYTYFRLPCGIILNLIQSYITGEPLIFLFILLLSLLPFFVIIGLHKRKKWGWNLNIVLLFVESFLYPISRSGGNLILYFVFVFLLGLCWILPNFIYFKKRIYLFNSNEKLKKDYIVGEEGTMYESSSINMHKFILPKEITCKNCGAEVELEENERKEGKFTCPECDKFFDNSNYT